MDDVRVVTATGDVDLASAPRLGQVLRQEVERAPGTLLVDLSATRHLDSSGVSVLLNAHRRLTRLGAGFAVVAPEGAPRRVLELTGVAETLGVGPSRSQALANAA
jgi:anti-anti-sigma factor